MINKGFILFPGQGAQYPGMALDLLEAKNEIKELFSLASDISGMDMEDLLRNSSPEELKKTDISQPAITLANLGAAKYLELRGVKTLGCAGFSLGEYSALALAGIISLEDCFLLVKERGEAMQRAVDNIQALGQTPGKDPPGMAAVLGLSPSRVESLLAEWKIDELYTANINSPRQLVVSGSSAALKEAEKRFKEAGARRVVILQVAGPFHSPLMKEAADLFAPALEKVNFRDPAIPVFSNVTGDKIKSGDEAKNLALRHIVEGVRWTDLESSIAELKPEALLEAGPGKVLQGLWKDLENGIPCHGAGTIEEIEELLKQ